MDGNCAQLYWPLYEAFMDMYNAVSSDWEVLRLNPELDRAWRRVFYEAYRGNGLELPPFEEYLHTYTDFDATHTPTLVS